VIQWVEHYIIESPAMCVPIHFARFRVVCGR
jgi:hypothetical protein